MAWKGGKGYSWVLGMDLPSPITFECMNENHDL